MTHSDRTALILGATGLVGGHLLDRLLSAGTYGKVVSLGRHSVPRTHPHLEQHLVDLGDPASFEAFTTVDAVFCCLGTTMKEAGSKEAFRKVDQEYPVAVARAAREKGAKAFLVVSSMGSNAKSPFFYSRVKGEMEQALRELDFASLGIFRPSLLVGRRKEARRGEAVAESVLKIIQPLLLGPLRNLRPTEADDVAAAMLHTAQAPPAGPTVFDAEAIRKAAKR